MGGVGCCLAGRLIRDHYISPMNDNAIINLYHHHHHIGSQVTTGHHPPVQLTDRGINLEGYIMGMSSFNLPIHTWIAAVSISSGDELQLLGFNCINKPYRFLLLLISNHLPPPSVSVDPFECASRVITNSSTNRNPPSTREQGISVVIRLMCVVGTGGALLRTNRSRCPFYELRRIHRHRRCRSIYVRGYSN